MTSPCFPEILGSDPANINWQVVRGDTAKIRIEFLQNNEVDYYDTSGWSYAASTYDFRGDIIDELLVDDYEGYVDVIVPSEISTLWGDSFSGIVAELAFDLQVTLDNDDVWTPVVGIIKVIGDVTRRSL